MPTLLPCDLQVLPHDDEAAEAGQDSCSGGAEASGEEGEQQQEEGESDAAMEEGDKLQGQQAAQLAPAGSPAAPAVAAPAHSPPNSSSKQSPAAAIPVSEAPAGAAVAPQPQPAAPAQQMQQQMEQQLGTLAVEERAPQEQTAGLPKLVAPAKAAFAAMQPVGPAAAKQQSLPQVSMADRVLLTRSYSLLGVPSNAGLNSQLSMAGMQQAPAGGGPKLPSRLGAQPASTGGFSLLGNFTGGAAQPAPAPMYAVQPRQQQPQQQPRAAAKQPAPRPPAAAMQRQQAGQQHQGTPGMALPKHMQAAAPKAATPAPFTPGSSTTPAAAADQEHQAAAAAAEAAAAARQAAVLADDILGFSFQPSSVLERHEQSMAESLELCAPMAEAVQEQLLVLDQVGAGWGLRRGAPGIDKGQCCASEGSGARSCSPALACGLHSRRLSLLNAPFSAWACCCSWACMLKRCGARSTVCGLTSPSTAPPWHSWTAPCRQGRGTWVLTLGACSALPCSLPV
jgi:hypothetical protein